MTFLMPYDEFLTGVLDAGIAAARADYVRPDQAAPLAASENAYRACRGLTPEQIQRAYDQADRLASEAIRDHPLETGSYWRLRWIAVEIEWICNVLSARRMFEGQPPLLPHLPTARGVTAAAQILGILTESVPPRDRVPGDPCACDPRTRKVCERHQEGL